MNLDPKNFIYAILGGILPAILWLWFWLKEEDNDEPEPLSLIILTFLLGGLLVFVAVWFERFAQSFISDSSLQIFVWALIEELIKFGGVSLIIFGNNRIRQPIDFPMYFIALALGFAALENFFFLIDPLTTEGTVVGMLTGNLRFLGSTLLHAISSGMIGSALGLSFFIKKHRRYYLTIGIFCAVLLHSLFNFFIIKGSDGNSLGVFGFLWVVTIINILIFEKLKRMGRKLIVTSKSFQ